MTENLPEGWVVATLGELTENFDSQRIPVKSKDRDAMHGEYPYFGASGVIDQVSSYIFDGTYLLIAEDGANLLSRSTPIAFKATGKFWVNNHAHVVRSANGVMMPYIEYFINSFDLRLYITGTAQPKLTQNNLNKIPTPLPPLNEQKRIVEKLEQLLSELDKAVDALKTAQEKLKTYRRAVLKAAVEGELSRAWREENKEGLEPADKLLRRILAERRKKWEEAELEKMRAKGKEPEDDEWKAKYKEPQELSEQDLEKLPNGWCWASGDQLSSKIVDGTHHTPTYRESGVAFVSVKDVRDGKIYFDNCKFISEEEHEKLFQRCNPEIEDVLITKSGTIGRTAVVRTDRRFSLFVSVALIKRASTEQNPDFLRLSLDGYIAGINIAILRTAIEKR